MITTINEYKLNEAKVYEDDLISITKGLYVNIIMIFINKDAHLSPKIKEILQNQVFNFSIIDIDNNIKLRNILMKLNDESLESIMLILEQKYKNF